MCRHFGAVSLQGGPTTHQKWGAKEPHKIAAPPIHYHYHYHQRQNLLPAIQVHSLPPPYVLSGSKPVPSHAHSLHTRNIKCQRTAPTFIRLITIIRDSSNNTRGDEPSVEDTASRVGFPFVDTSKTIICRVCFYKGDDWCNFQFLRVKGRPQLMIYLLGIFVLCMPKKWGLQWKSWKSSSATVFTDFSLKEIQDASNSIH